MPHPGNDPRPDVAPALKASAPALEAQVGPRWLRDVLRRPELRIEPGHRVALTATGRAGLDAMFQAIAAAHTRIDLEIYILRDDDTGRRLLATLEARARDGVAVRLLVDGVGSFALPDAALDPLRAAGGDARRFFSILERLRAWRLRNSDHRKLMVVDERVAFVGGLNVGDEYAASLPDDSAAWRDALVRLEGPGVARVAGAFRESWARARPGHWRRRRPRRVAGRPGPALATGGLRVGVLCDGPLYRRRRMRELVIDALTNARNEVLLVTPYFLPGRALLRAIEAAATRGVAVTLVTAGASDHPLLRRAMRRLLPRLLGSGVRIFEDEGRMLHAKAIAVDDHFAVLGSSNLDRQSLRHAYELNLVFDAAEVAQWIVDHFGPRAGALQEVTKAALARRGFVERCADALAGWVGRLI